jgi:signal transduction histidine kinase/streptogramin lyase
MLRDRDGRLWMAIPGRGLAHVHDGRTDLFGQSDGLSGNFATALFEDREGSIWVATGNGLDRFRDFAISTYSIEQGLSNASITSVLAALDGSIWIGTLDGLNRWDRGQLTVYREQHRPTPAGVREIVGPGLPDRGVHSLFQDDRGRIWISDRRGAGYLEQDRLVPVKDVPGGNVHGIVGDNAGGLWIASEQLSHVLPGNVVEPIPWARFGDGKVGEPLVWDPFRRGLWLGFLQGGIAYFAGGEVRTRYGAADGLGKGNVVRLRIDRAGALWVSTDGGLSRLKDGHLATLNTKNGLPCDSVHWSIEDDADSLWIYMGCGLVRIQRTELENWAAASENGKMAMVPFTAFDNSDGAKLFGAHTTYSPQAAKAPDGKIWFGTPDGVSVIDPRNLHFNKLPPPVHIEQIKADGKTYGVSRGVRLPALVRDVRIDYTALSFAAPEKVLFRYKLEGQDTSWKEAVTGREVQYTNLKPRRYRFRVMACNNSGVWNEAGDTLDFSVDPAYYQTGWFQALCAAAFLTLLWGLYRYRVHQIAREFNVRLEERVDERTRIARDLHDTMLQSFQGMMLRFQVGIELLPPGKARDTFEQALERGDQAIAEGREAIHDLRSSTEITNDLARAMTAVGDEASAASGSNPPQFRVVVEGPSRELHPIVRDEIYRIAREALRNAFRHAQASQIEAEIAYSEGLLKVRIRDDGRGMNPEIVKQGRGGHYGLPGIRERARQIGGQLNVWSAPGAGTEIELRIPGTIAYGTAPAGKRWRLFRKNASHS